MESVGNTVVDMLTPYLGATMADTCVRVTAIGLGKSLDTLEPQDIPHICDSIRQHLSGVATQDVIDDLVSELEAMAR